MTVSISQVGRGQSYIPKLFEIDITSYTAGGETINASALGLSQVDHVIAMPNEKGFIPVWDKSNGKMKMMTNAPAIVIEEKHTAVSNVLTLDYPAAWIIAVAQTGQAMAWEKTGTAHGSLSASSFCLTSAISDGVQTGITTDGATDTVYVTYVTQAWAELYALLVQDEAVTIATGAKDLANEIMAFGYCHDATDGDLLPVEITDTTATAEVGVKYGYATGALDFHSDQNTHVAAVTYLKTAATGSFIADRYIADEDPAKSGGDPYINTFDFPMLLWCISGYVPSTGQTTMAIIDQATTCASGEANTQWLQPGTGVIPNTTTGAAPAAGSSFGGKDNITATAGAYIKGLITEVVTVPIEIQAGIDCGTMVLVVFGYPN